MKQMIPMSRFRSSGHTLIELMVAIIMGLIMVLAAFTVLANFEGNKRTTTAMGDALQSGNFGIYALDKLIRSAGTGVAQYGDIAGYGGPLNFVAATGQTVTNGAVAFPTPFNTILTTAGVASVGLAPAIIFPDTGSGSLKPGTDAVMLMLGGGGYGEVGVPITPSSASGGSLTVDSTVGMSTGEWILLGSSGIANCMITKVDANFLGTTNGNVLVPVTPATIGGAITASSFVNGYAVPLGMKTAANFSVFGVGIDNSLYTVDILNNLTSSQELTDDVVAFRAIYGVSTTPGASLTWVKPVVSGGKDYTPKALLSGTAAANTLLHTIRAMRIALIVRAPLQEKASSPGQDAFGNPFNPGSYTLFSSLASTAQYTWTVPSDQLNYRYRLIEATIPIRNGFF